MGWVNVDAIAFKHLNQALPELIKQKQYEEWISVECSHQAGSFISKKKNNNKNITKTTT